LALLIWHFIRKLIKNCSKLKLRAVTEKYTRLYKHTNTSSQTNILQIKLKLTLSRNSVIYSSRLTYSARTGRLGISGRNLNSS